MDALLAGLGAQTVNLISFGVVLIPRAASSGGFFVPWGRPFFPLPFVAISVGEIRRVSNLMAEG